MPVTLKTMLDPERLPQALQPLRLPVFRMLWLAWLAANGDRVDLLVNGAVLASATFVLRH